MSNVIIALYGNPAAAESVLQALNVTVAYRKARVADICLIYKDKSGDLKISQKFSRPDHFFLAGLVLGGLLGAVAGVTMFSMFAMPIMILGGAIGGLAAAAGYAMLTDIGLSDDFLNQLGTEMRNDTSAIAVLQKSEAQKWLVSALEKGGADNLISVPHDAREEDAALRTMAAMTRAGA